MADIGERLGGDDIHFTIDQPLRVIIGGPPHSGKSTLMNLLEDRFRYYQIPVELLDLDLASPTPLKTGFTEQREKRKWTSTLAKEARAMFEEAEGVQVVLGDSVGLITDINEIISQPADVAILLVSGGHGDYDTTYRKVVRKWKEYYEDIHKPLLVVLRSTMNPADESMFDPQDNYGVIVGMDRDAYDQRLISGHYRYEGTYPTNACLEGIVFEIAQSFDMKVRSATDPEHLEILNAKWPELKDKKTWTPSEGSVMGGLENAYYDERGIVPADQRAESFRAEADDWKALKATYEPYIGRKVNFITTYDDYGEMVTFKDIETIGFIDWDGEMGGSGEPEFRTKEGDRWMTIDYVKENLVEDTEAESFSAESRDELIDTLIEIRQELAKKEGMEDWENESEGPLDSLSSGFIQELIWWVDGDRDTWNTESFGAEDDLTFQEWADQEMMTHGKPEPFDDWLDDELSHHGDNVSLHDWGNHELDSHYERYGAESKTHRRIKQEAAYSQMMIASLIGLGAGLWGVSKWRDSQRSL